MTIRKIYNVVDNRLVIKLPQSFANRKRVLVTVEDEINSRERKIALLKYALTDPIYLTDINEINDDFKFSDAE